MRYFGKTGKYILIALKQPTNLVEYEEYQYMEYVALVIEYVETVAHHCADVHKE